MSTNIVLLGVLGTTEIIIILIIVLLLFGGRKIPELMRGIGRGVREFRGGVRGDDEKKTDKPDSSDSEKKEDET